MSRFARLGLGAGSTSRRLFLGLSGSGLGIYYASTFRKVHADSDFQSRPQQGNRETYSFKPHVGVHRVDTVFWPANYPAEDVLTSLYVQPMSWSFWSVYDGHVGPQAAWHLEKHLLPNLAESLHALYSKGVQPHTEAIYSTIKNVFVSLDDEMAPPIRALAARALQTAHAGSCALVAFYDKNVRTLHISLTGDSRALLGRARKAADGKTVYDVQFVSADQNGLNPAEVARLSAEHPGEELFKGSRYMGWGISRSFGNGVLKWSRELQNWMEERCLGNKPRDTLLTPPYFTAEPEITSTVVEPGDFLVMASDGLVVGLVGLWLERNENVSNATLLPEEEQAIERAELPVTLTDNQTHYPYWPTVKKQFVNVDSNVARHLARNSLGGADKDMHVALLSTPSPRARRVRDDVSVIVVFFE
ncbi:protein serine threonine phosphatase 2C [Mycena olivaceomarginata]|nr:protein serine threonine phosphatase 2C [Mycena olivaceomarginata]